MIARPGQTPVRKGDCGCRRRAATLVLTSLPEDPMKLATTLVLAAVAITIGLTYAADKKDFNGLDKNGDGYLTRTEAASDSNLTKKFKEVDKNGDAKISRAEYAVVKKK